MSQGVRRLGSSPKRAKLRTLRNARERTIEQVVSLLVNNE
jgi:hypothetical protein